MCTADYHGVWCPGGNPPPNGWIHYPDVSLGRLDVGWYGPMGASWLNNTNSYAHLFEHQPPLSTRALMVACDDLGPRGCTNLLAYGWLFNWASAPGTDSYLHPTRCVRNETGTITVYNATTVTSLSGGKYKECKASDSWFALYGPAIAGSTSAKCLDLCEADPKSACTGYTISAAGSCQLWTAPPNTAGVPSYWKIPSSS